jgi:hypothetical protein
MIHLVHVFVKVLAGIAGVLFVYAAVVLYEDERGKLQYRLEHWWVEISEREKTATPRYAVFMPEVARIATGLFDGLLGAKFFSWRARSDFFVTFYPAARQPTLVKRLSFQQGCQVASAD